MLSLSFQPAGRVHRTAHDHPQADGVGGRRGADRDDRPEEQGDRESRRERRTRRSAPSACSSTSDGLEGFGDARTGRGVSPDRAEGPARRSTESTVSWTGSPTPVSSSRADRRRCRGPSTRQRSGADSRRPASRRRKEQDLADFEPRSGSRDGARKPRRRWAGGRVRLLLLRWPTSVRREHRRNRATPVSNRSAVCTLCRGTRNAPARRMCPCTSSLPKFHRSTERITR